MTNIKLITVCSHPEHAEVLRRSAGLHEWDFVCIHVPEWKGFGTKLIATYNYLKEHPEVERFVFCDAFDVVVFGTPEEFEEKTRHISNSWILVSAERGLWPPYLHPFERDYQKFDHGFNFINSGVYYSWAKNFIEAIEKYKPTYETDDQFWFNNMYLTKNMLTLIDSSQDVFNSHSFISEGEYTYNNGRIQIMGNEPLFVHSNGRSVDPKLDKLVNEMLG